MGVLEHTTRLVSLSLAGCFQLSFKTLAELPKLPHLQMLNLSVFKRMTFAGLASLRVCNSLKDLSPCSPCIILCRSHIDSHVILAFEGNVEMAQFACLLRFDA